MAVDNETLLKALRDLPGTLSTLNATLASLRRGTAVSAITTGALINVYSVSFNRHLFRQTEEPLQALPQKQTLPHKVDAIIVKGSYDYQVEYDGNVTDNTPVTNALEYQNFQLEVKEYFTYQISPAAITGGLGSGAKGTMNYWAFWRD